MFLQIVLMMAVLFAVSNIMVHSCPIRLGDPQANLLTRSNLNNIILTGYPNTKTESSTPATVVDEESYMENKSPQWQQHGYQTFQDSSEIAYLKVDLKLQYIIRATAVTGYPLGNYKPKGDWYLEGSNDDKSWRMVGIGKAEQWLTPGTYPFQESQIVRSLYPAKYRYYRVISRGWTNGYMLIYNWGLFA